jgi:MFS transporter, FLVCR family, feline leukemia virus subgroup C receptor-related protein
LTVLLGMAGNCLGAWIKVLSVHPDRFWVSFVGQTVVAISQVYVMSTPAPVAATWFGPSQVATACAIGVNGLQVSFIK